MNSLQAIMSLHKTPLHEKIIKHGFLGNRGITLPLSAFTETEINQIKKELWMKPFVPKMMKTADTEEFPVYRESTTKLYVPRFYIYNMLTAVGYAEPWKRIPSKLNTATSIDIPFKGTLRDFQIPIVDAYMAESKRSGCGLLELMCAAGKTVLSLYIASELKVKTIVIVHKEFLLNQWVERIQEFLPTARIGRLQGQVIDIEDKDIVIAMLQSLSMKDYPLSLFSSFGLSIFDECHHISAEVFCRSLFKVVTPYVLGLSATMNRKDGLTKLFKMFLGNIVYSKLTRDEDYNVQIRNIHYSNEDKDYTDVIYNYMGQIHHSIMIKRICEFTPRSEFILKVLTNLLKEEPRHQVMILAHNKSLLKYLYTAIENRNIAKVGYYVGGMKEKDLKDTADNKQVVVATYAMAEEALDIKTLSALMMCTPRADVTQAVGRILRIKHEYRPIVVDIVDEHDVFHSQWEKRKTFYKKNSYEMVELSHEEYLFNTPWRTIKVKSSKSLSNTCLIKL
jgi:superfamily II DNA or RNA helicase